jgi:hypothetical protein
VLEDGRVSEQGTYRELVTHENSRFRELMRAQLDAAAGERDMWSAAACPPDVGVADLPKLQAKVRELEAEVQSRASLPS